MKHKYNVGNTVWVASQSGYIEPYPMIITDIHINDKGVYYDGNELAFGRLKPVHNKSEELLYLTQEDCIEFMNKRTLDDCYQKRNTLLDELEGLNNKIRQYEELVK